MIDYFDIATNVDTQLFFANAAPSGSAITSGSWQTWTKPRNASFVFITAFGSGGGGGGAYASGSYASLTAFTGSGGGGGGAAAFSKAIYPASLIPDILYIRVAAGGPGAPGGNNNQVGQSGSLSYVCVFPTSSYRDTDIRDANILLVSGDRAAGGGIAGTPAAGGIGGSGGAAATLTRPLQGLGIVQSYNGTLGSTGGIGNTNGSNIIIRNLTSGGTGGSGARRFSDLRGGQILSQSIVPTIVGEIQNGTDGFAATQPNTAVSQRYPQIFTGGIGGGIDTEGFTGLVGNGAIGSGGGGASPGVTPSLNARGGNGGNGLVIITCF